MKANATEVKTHFGHYIDIVQKGEPVIIERSGKETAAIIDYSEYQHLKSLDNLLLSEKIRQAEAKGYLDDAASDKFFRQLIGRLADDFSTEAE